MIGNLTGAYPFRPRAGRQAPDIILPTATLHIKNMGDSKEAAAERDKRLVLQIPIPLLEMFTDRMILRSRPTVAVIPWFFAAIAFFYQGCSRSMGAADFPLPNHLEQRSCAQLRCTVFYIAPKAHAVD
jgi:hypothetical protein